MAKTSSINECIIKSNPHRELACGYTKVKVMPDNYSQIILIAGMTGKAIQDLANELLSYAIANAIIEIDGKRIKLSDVQQEVLK